MKIQTKDLTGPALDWAVAKCEGIEWENGDLDAAEYGPGFRPSVDWAHGGPIIEREGMVLHPYNNGWVAGIDVSENPAKSLWAARSKGPTPLVAAMRCYVMRLGHEIEVPQELSKEK